MKKSLALSLALAVCAVGAITPAQADDTSLKGCAVNAVMLPVKAVGIGTGMIVGVPMAILRRSSNRCIECTETGADHLGGREHGPPMVLAAVLGYPMGMIVGTGEGLYAGTRNAIQHGSEKPFSLASMSLADDLGGDYAPAGGGSTHKTETKKTETKTDKKESK
ncbi:MAG: hypothetical protein ACRD3W_21075 [Terriglobales bacterium]